jgi:voltage-gated potassium channel
VVVKRPKSVIEGRVSKQLAKPVSIRNAAQAIAFVSGFLIVVSGALMRALDHDQFPNVWLGIWWAAQTVTTVGYGDVVPTSVWGRLVAVATMLIGVAIVSVVTAIITSTFIERARQERQEKAEPKIATDAKVDEAVQALNERFDQLDTLVRAGKA